LVVCIVDYQIGKYPAAYNLCPLMEKMMSSDSMMKQKNTPEKR